MPEVRELKCFAACDAGPRRGADKNLEIGGVIHFTWR
jgi:hypothetical protein